ncbi:MAG: chemotaxis protein CheW, partial [Terriglobia bacterium]
ALGAASSAPTDYNTGLKMAAKQQFATFLLAGNFFGVDVNAVQEILRYQDMTSVPLAPSIVSGLINLRGQIVTAIDLRRRLEMKERDPGKVPVNVVVRSSEGIVSLLVDEIGDVVEVADDTFELPPETLSGKAREMVLGVHKLTNKLMHVLDTERVACEGNETQR